MTEQQKDVYLLIPKIYEYLTLYAKGTFRCEQIKVLKWEIILNYSAMMSLHDDMSLAWCHCKNLYNKKSKEEGGEMTEIEDGEKGTNQRNKEASRIWIKRNKILP